MVKEKADSVLISQIWLKLSGRTQNRCSVTKWWSCWLMVESGVGAQAEEVGQQGDHQAHGQGVRWFGSRGNYYDYDDSDTALCAAACSGLLTRCATAYCNDEFWTSISSSSIPQKDAQNMWLWKICTLMFRPKIEEQFTSSWKQISSAGALSVCKLDIQHNDLSVAIVGANQREEVQGLVFIGWTTNITLWH